ncbi:MAG TPA: M13 family metallopeptidase [Cyclobacteriaceae bacterium]
MNKILLFVSIALAASSCVEQEPAARKYVDVAGLSSSIKPGDNFFLYVNGTWYDKVKIADDQSGIGSYSFLNIPQKVLLQNILKEIAAGTHPQGSDEQKVGDFYASGMDSATINLRGYEPMQPMLDKIEDIKSKAELMHFVAGESKLGDNSILRFNISPDDKNSTINIAHFSQAGIGLPDRDYYFKTDAPTLGIQNSYKDYIATLFELIGDAPDEATRKAELVFNIEQQLATSHKTRIERRDVQKNYNMMSVTKLQMSQPNFGWNTLLQELGMDTDTLDIRQPAYYDKLNEMLQSVSLNDWKVYLKANTMSNYSSYLSRPFEQASFEYRKALSGQASEQPRSQVIAQVVDRQMGFTLGKIYVKRHFGEDDKKRVSELVDNLTKAFENRISNLDWMSDSTKAKAKEKLNAITKKLGYPDIWREYNVTIKRDQYFENVMALAKDDYQYQLDKLNKPPYRHEWGPSPSTVTAYYRPSFNEIVFPAGILQYPYFDLYADDAINYGGIGMVIGHELTHAFDDQGSQFDKDGNVKNWWTDEDNEKFKAKTQLLIDRYSTFTVLDSLHIKGAMTIGENTADNGGISIAYDAFKLTEQGQSDTKIDGFTPDQRFFLSVARIWRVKTRDEYMRTYVNTNPHSPAMWRVNGPLMNFTPFYEAFDVQPGDKNYKPEEERIKIW